MSENTPPMGDDRLAWLTNEYDIDTTKTQPAVKGRVRSRRTASRRKVVTAEKEKTEIDLVEESFVTLAPQSEAIAARFYQRLFEFHPAVTPLFSISSITEQQKKLAAALVFIVQNLRKPEILREYLTGLGTRHAHYGVTKEHYPLVTESLVAVMEEFAGDTWTLAVKQAWEDTLDSIAAIMLEAYEKVDIQKKVLSNEALVIDNKKMLDLESQLAAISNIMGVISFDMDGTIIDINQYFLDLVGYNRNEVINKHYRVFAEQSMAASAEYSDLWSRLNHGDNYNGEYKCIAKDGSEVWLQASYHPIADEKGQLYKVVHYASDITAHKVLKITVDKIMMDTTFVMSSLVKGDFTQTLEGEYKEVFSEFQTSVNETVIKFAQTVNSFNDIASDIDMKSSEVTEYNSDLHQKKEKLASSVENAEGETVRDGIAINELGTSRKKITEILDVLDDIAFQTNLLALNGSVEAARADEHGRGFAGIASKVRKLAQQSASASKEIKSLINDNAEKVKEVGAGG